MADVNLITARRFCFSALMLVAAGAPSGTLRAAEAPVVAVFPHDRTAFTEGLFIRNGALFESTGLNGKSRLTKTELKTGRVLASVELAPEYFGEGATELGGRIFQLTWKDEVGFIYDAGTLAPVGKFSYRGEGWGLTTDGHSLIMSNGSNVLRWLDPQTFAVTKSLEVRWRGRAVQNLNELEFIDGQILANVWQEGYIVQIDAATGEVSRAFDCSDLLGPAELAGADVLNGIAFDFETRALYVTGKNWPKLFQVQWKP